MVVLRMATDSGPVGPSGCSSIIHYDKWYVFLSCGKEDDGALSEQPLACFVVYLVCLEHTTCVCCLSNDNQEDSKSTQCSCFACQRRLCCQDLKILGVMKKNTNHNNNVIEDKATKTTTTMVAESVVQLLAWVTSQLFLHILNTMEFIWDKAVMMQGLSVLLLFPVSTTITPTLLRVAACYFATTTTPTTTTRKEQ